MSAQSTAAQRTTEQRDAFLVAYIRAMSDAARYGGPNPDYPWIDGARPDAVARCAYRMTNSLIEEAGTSRDVLRDSRYMRAAAKAVGATTSPELRALAAHWPRLENEGLPQIIASRGEGYAPNLDPNEGAPTLGEMMEAGARGHFAQELIRARRNIGDAEQLTRAYARADEHNRAALDQAYLRATGARLSQLVRVEDSGGGLPPLSQAQFELLRKSLDQEFLGLALAPLAIGPASILARLPIRTPEGWRGLEDGSCWLRTDSPEWARMWAALGRRYNGDTDCLCEAEGWQYMGSVRYSPPVGWVHTFRHRALREGPHTRDLSGPLPPRRYLWAVLGTTADEMAASLSTPPHAWRAG